MDAPMEDPLNVGVRKNTAEREVMSALITNKVLRKLVKSFLLEKYLTYLMRISQVFCGQKVAEKHHSHRKIGL